MVLAAGQVSSRPGAYLGEAFIFRGADAGWFPRRCAEDIDPRNLGSDEDVNEPFSSWFGCVGTHGFLLITD